MKQTVGSILRSFQNSGKRHLLLTGERGAGKSSRFTELEKLLCPGAPGISTKMIPGEGVLLRENHAENAAFIGKPRPERRGMSPLEEGFRSLGVPALERAAAASGDWISMDELGFLESGCPPFQQAVLRCFEEKRVIAVLRKQDLPFLNLLKEREDVFLFDVDTPAQIGCVLMASGKSSRFGSNKLLADFEGQPLLQRIVAATEGLFARRIVVTRSEEVAELCRLWGVEVLLHDLPDRNDTVRLGTEALRDMDGLVFTPCDQPLLRRETVARLLDWPYLRDDLLLRPCCGEREGSPVFFGKQYFPDLQNLPEKAGGSHILKQHRDKLQLLPIEDEGELMDVDTVTDLETLKARQLL